MTQTAHVYPAPVDPRFEESWSPVFAVFASEHSGKKPDAYETGDEADEPAAIARDNTVRASVAAAALATFAELCYFAEEGEPVDNAMSDFLADFMHLCDVTGQDFGGLCDRARGHYTAELAGDL